MKKQRPSEKVQLLTVDELLGVPNEEATTEIRIDEIDICFLQYVKEQLSPFLRSKKYKPYLTRILLLPVE